MKHSKIFFALVLISLFIFGIQPSVNAQNCKVHFYNCCGDSVYYEIYQPGEPQAVATFWTWSDGWVHTMSGGGINFTALQLYYITYPCADSPIWFTPCICGNEDTLKLPCCDMGFDKGDNIKDRSIPPTEYKLGQNFPNPFNPSTMISFEIPENSNVTLTIYDIMGKVVEQPFLNTPVNSGYHQYIWDTVNKGLASGIYLYKLEAGTYSETKKMMLIK
jgi:hypothetical protein